MTLSVLRLCFTHPPPRRHLRRRLWSPQVRAGAISFFPPAKPNLLKVFELAIDGLNSHAYYSQKASIKCVASALAIERNHQAARRTFTLIPMTCPSSLRLTPQGLKTDAPDVALSLTLMSAATPYLTVPPSNCSRAIWGIMSHSIGLRS